MELVPRIDDGGCSRRTPEIMDLPSDVLVRILGLLDGPTLASATSASSCFHSLSHPLWRELARRAWPSTADPRLSSVRFRDGFHSLFSDAFPGLCSYPFPPPPPPPATNRLLSAVDLRRGGSLIFSRVVETETRSGWFLSSPFRIDALDGNEPPPDAKAPSPSPVKSLEAELTLTWVVVDPGTGRAADFSSRRPVSVHRHWLTGEIQVRFAVILNRVTAGSAAAEPVQVGILVTCEGGEEEHVREVSLQVEDMEGMNLNGEDSLVVLQRALGGQRKKKEVEDEEEREKYLEFLELKRVNKEKKMRKEGRLDMACVLVGLLMFAAFWVFVIYC